jgi:hypothetical protein
VASDRKRFEALQSGNYTAWRDPTLQEIEAAGEHEILTWTPLAGAVDELGQKPTCYNFIESHPMNSCKCVAIFPPSETTVGA